MTYLLEIFNNFKFLVFLILYSVIYWVGFAFLVEFAPVVDNLVGFSISLILYLLLIKRIYVRFVYPIKKAPAKVLESFKQ